MRTVPAHRVNREAEKNPSFKGFEKHDLRGTPRNVLKKVF